MSTAPRNLLVSDGENIQQPQHSKAKAIAALQEQHGLPKRAPLGDISNQVSALKHSKNAKVEKPLQVKISCEVEPQRPISHQQLPATVPMELDEVEYDIDEVDIAHMDDPQWVAEYAAEIYEHYFQVELVHRADPSYMDRQKDLRPDMRRILIDWLVEVHNMFKLKQETLFLAVNLLDRFLAMSPLARNRLQLLGSTALFVASKYEEMFAPEVEDFVYVSDKAFGREDVLMCESQFCTTLSFLFSVPTPFHFAQRFAQVAEFDERSTLFANYLMELSLLELSFLAYPPSTLAASAVYLTTYFDGQPWSDDLIQHTRYVYSDIRPCVKEMYALLAADKTNNAVAKKYSSKARKRVAQVGQQVVEAQIRQHQEQQSQRHS